MPSISVCDIDLLLSQYTSTIDINFAITRALRIPIFLPTTVDFRYCGLIPPS